MSDWVYTNEKKDGIFCMDALEGISGIKNRIVNLILTSPPYNMGKEYEKKTSLEYYIEWQRLLILQYYRVLSDDGSIVYQVGNYVHSGSVYPLDCLLFNEFIKAGFIPRNRIIWSFGHGLHCNNRFSPRYETALWFSKTKNYTFNLDDIRIPQKYPNKKHYKGKKKGELSCNPLGKNPGDIWEITNIKNNHPEKTLHPCQYPIELTDRFIKALSNKEDLVLDPFIGSGTTAISAVKNNRHYLGFDNHHDYIEIATKRIMDISKGL